MRLFGKKGMEKPIEIFVALFVILAVALLLLNIFEDQLSSQQDQLDQIQSTERQEELFDAAVDYCMDDRRCPSISTHCDIEYLARLCRAYATDAPEFEVGEFLDLNRDGTMGIDESQIPGTQVCEDDVPCFAVVSECCGQRINANNCKTILENFAAREGFDASETDDFLARSVEEPSAQCRGMPGFEEDLHWYCRAGFGDC